MTRLEAHVEPARPRRLALPFLPHRVADEAALA